MRVSREVVDFFAVGEWGGIVKVEGGCYGPGVVKLLEGLMEDGGGDWVGGPDGEGGLRLCG